MTSSPPYSSASGPGDTIREVPRRMATIVAIRRGTSRIVSPGPDAELYGGDEVIFVGTDNAREAVSRFFRSTE